MERESFEDEGTAKLLNQLFVPVKLDREERPDVDHVYMQYVQATTGSGGWPMSVWLTPDLEPFYGGTYFPPDSRYGRPGFGYLLAQIASAWRERRDQLAGAGKQALAVLGESARLEVGATGATAAAPGALATFQRMFDARYGGFGQAPKFPRPAVCHFLFRYSSATGDASARDMALQTLRAMARGGMHDHLGGGFHRYSVDERWHVPHFEKMLYDQAQLAESYVEAFLVTGDPAFARTARETLDYVLRDMTGSGGAFHSAEDADSAVDASRPHEKGEGAYYIWGWAELETVLGKERAGRFAKAFACMPEGNVHHDPHGEFTGKNVLFAAEEVDWSDPDWASIRRDLMAARARRPRPHMDDKVLTAWNGLMISALAKAAQAFGESFAEDSSRYARAAAQASDFLFDSLWSEPEGRLLRRWRDGEAAIDGMLDDYAFLAQSQLDLYEAIFDPRCLERAAALARAMVRRFHDPVQGGFYSSSNASRDLVLLAKDDYDGAEPAGNSVAADVLLRLSALTGEESFESEASRLLDAFAGRLAQQPAALPRMLSSALRRAAPKSQVVIAGAPGAGPVDRWLAEYRRALRPFTTLVVAAASRGPNPALEAMREIGGRPAAYVCRDFRCAAPVTTADGFADLLE
jgi:hypothetical protein